MKKTSLLIFLITSLLVSSFALAYIAFGERAGVLLATIANGVLLGGFYGLTAMGLSLVFGITKIINVCHGEFVVLGAYVSYWLAISYCVNPITLIASFPILFVVGLVIGKTLMNHAIKMGIDQPLLVAFGLSLCLRNLMRYLWTATPRGISIPMGGLPLSGGTYISYLSLMIFCVSVVGLLSLHLFLKNTFVGKAIRAAGQHQESAKLMGINVDNINALAYALGLLLAAVAGSLVSLRFSFDPESGSMFLGRALCAVVLGGVGHILGALAGGMILGVVESIGAFFLGDVMRDAIVFLIFLAILLVKPTGLFAKYRAF